MPREMLKLRKGDSAIMIKADGSIELAGVQDKELIDSSGRMSPVILFAAAWAKRDQTLMASLLENFKVCVREGYFGDEAKNDFARAEGTGGSGAVTQTQATSGAVTTEQKTLEDYRYEEEVRQLDKIVAAGQDPRVKKQLDALKKGATKIEEKPYTGSRPDDDWRPEGWDEDTGTVVKTEQPTPLTAKEQLERRDS
jgi:hypothetical protein